MVVIYNDYQLMNRTNRSNYEARQQGKIDNRMHKHLRKTALRHEDEITRLNLERRKKVELEQAGIVPGPAQSPGKNNGKYLLVLLACLGAILFLSFQLLERKAEGEKQEY